MCTYRGVDLDELLDMSRQVHSIHRHYMHAVHVYTYRGVDLDQLLDMSR